jgi:hypothetical protein
LHVLHRKRKDAPANVHADARALRSVLQGYGPPQCYEQAVPEQTYYLQLELLCWHTALLCLALLPGLHFCIGAAAIVSSSSAASPCPSFGTNQMLSTRHSQGSGT